MDARALVNNARARGQLTQADADLLWAQNLTAQQMARVLLLLSRGSSLRALLSRLPSDSPPVASDATS